MEGERVEGERSEGERVEGAGRRSTNEGASAFLGFRALSSRFRVQVTGFRAQGPRFRVQVLGL